MPSGSFSSFGRDGKGKWITTYSNGGHMYVMVAGLALRVAHHRRRPRLGKQKATKAGYVVRHPKRPLMRHATKKPLAGLCLCLALALMRACRPDRGPGGQRRRRRRRRRRRQDGRRARRRSSVTARPSRRGAPRRGQARDRRGQRDPPQALQARRRTRALEGLGLRLLGRRQLRARQVRRSASSTRRCPRAASTSAAARAPASGSPSTPTAATCT